MIVVIAHKDVVRDSLIISHPYGCRIEWRQFIDEFLYLTLLAKRITVDIQKYSSSSPL